MTNEIEAKAYGIFDQIDAMGGVLKAVDRGYFRRSIAESALDQQKKLDRGEAKIVGVTDFVETGPHGVEILQITPETERVQVNRLKELKRRRDASRHAAALERIHRDAMANANMMPALIDAARADATVGEMMDVMASAFGRYDGGPEW